MIRSGIYCHQLKIFMGTRTFLDFATFQSQLFDKVPTKVSLRHAQ